MPRPWLGLGFAARCLGLVLVYLVVLLTSLIVIVNKKAVLSQGNRAMSQLLFLV